MNTSSNKEYHYNLLFICLGNICRSPAADAIMHKLVDDNGLSRNFTIDSAGIGNWHVVAICPTEECVNMVQSEAMI